MVSTALLRDFYFSLACSNINNLQSLQLQWNQIAEFYSARLPPAIFCQACPSWGNQELEQEMCVCYGHSCTARKTTIKSDHKFSDPTESWNNILCMFIIKYMVSIICPCMSGGSCFFNGSVDKIQTVSINLTITFLYPIPIQIGRALLALFQQKSKNY